MKDLIKKTTGLESLQKLYGDTFGKNGTMTVRLKGMKSLSDAERAALNAEKEELQSAFKMRQNEIETAVMLAELSKDGVDATRSPAPRQSGRLHPLTRSLAGIRAAFEKLGYEIASGPDIEDDWHNFTALNTPKYHPARDMQDTFFVEGGNVMRTQTTAVQIRELAKHGAPLRMFAPGTTYRREMDATHSAMFHQIDWFAANESLTVADLMSDIKRFFELFFEKDNINFRFRPSYFPFTEPSIEFDMEWGGKWLEMGGAGMIHPNVLKNCDINPEKFQGFAGAFGWDRLAMLKYGLNDVRKFTDGDIRWLKGS